MADSFSDRVFAVPSSMDIVGVGLLALTKAAQETQLVHLPANCKGTVVYFYHEAPLTQGEMEGTEIYDIAQMLSEDGADVSSDMTLYSPHPYALFFAGGSAAERREELLEVFHQGKLHNFLDSDGSAPQAAVVFSSVEGDSYISYAVSLRRSYEVFITIDGEGTLVPTNLMAQYTPLAVKQMWDILAGVSGEDTRFADIVAFEKERDLEEGENIFAAPTNRIRSKALLQFVDDEDPGCIALEELVDAWGPSDLA